MYFLSFRIFEQLALAQKNRFALEFFTVLKYFFIIQDFWATSACPENRVCHEIFQTRGGGRPRSPTPRLVRICMTLSIDLWLRLRRDSTRQCLPYYNHEMWKTN